MQTFIGGGKQDMAAFCNADWHVVRKWGKEQIHVGTLKYGISEVPSTDRDGCCKNTLTQILMKACSVYKL